MCYVCPYLTTNKQRLYFLKLSSHIWHNCHILLFKLQHLISKSEIEGSGPALAFKFQRNEMFIPRSLVKIQYCEEPPWPRGRVLGLGPPGLEFRILYLEGSGISFISPFSRGSPGRVRPICAQRWPKTPFISLQITARVQYGSYSENHSTECEKPVY